MTSNPPERGAVDAFLWSHVEAPAQLSTPREMAGTEEGLGIIIDVIAIPANEHLVPAGMFNQWPLEVLYHITKPFTGLVVLIDLVKRRRSSDDEGLLQLVTACVASQLGENEFGCRTTDGEFVMICPGQQGAAAQRRLNQISESLWEFQQRHGASLLFSWGGAGAVEKPLAEAMAAAVNRMNQINRNRKTNTMESVKNHRKIV